MAFLVPYDQATGTMPSFQPIYQFDDTTPAISWS